MFEWWRSGRGVIVWVKFVVVWFVCGVGAFSRCCCLGVCLREVFSVRLCWLDVEEDGGLRCGVLVPLGSLGAHTYRGWLVDVVGMSRAGSWWGVGSEAVRLRLRLPVCIVYVW